MPDPRLENLARVLVQYCVSVQPGDWVIIDSHPLALPLVNEVLREVLAAGGHPTLELNHDSLIETFFKYANDEQLRYISPLEPVITTQASATIAIQAAENTHNLSSVEPARFQRYRQSRGDLFKERMQRASTGSLRWTLTQYPCQAYAQDADMSLKQFEDFVYRATFADQPDPVAHWKRIHDEQQRLVEWLSGKDQVTVRGPNTDLTLSIAGRTFINSDGKHNMPSGEIFTGPVETSVNGWVHFTYPAVWGGRQVEGVELHFEDGCVTKASATKDQDFLLSMLDTDAGARFLGEFAVGTNFGIDRFTKSILFDEKMGGTIHMALGNGYPETGSHNESSIHWDLICDIRDDSEIRVDGELFYKNGEFKV